MFENAFGDVDRLEKAWLKEERSNLASFGDEIDFHIDRGFFIPEAESPTILALAPPASGGYVEILHASSEPTHERAGANSPSRGEIRTTHVDDQLEDDQ